MAAQAKSGGGGGAPKAFTRRTALRDIEEWAQKLWDEEKTFQSSCPEEEGAEPLSGTADEKYFCTFPYPYMNGRLHIGHAFTMSKAEFAAGYHRLKGKRVLFPFGFHCSGMPIQASAVKLKKELDEFGVPPQFPEDSPAAIAAAAKAAADAQAEEAAASSGGKGKGKGGKKEKGGKKGMKNKTKILQKTGGVKRQWTILKKSGVPEEEIPKFTDPQYWLDYFPPYGMSDLKRFGTHVDWRRSFITTARNPYYDSFIRWQFRKLRGEKEAGEEREKRYIDFGKRPTIYSVADGQACMDHDRSEGEGKGPQEYTLIKIRVLTDGDGSNGALPPKVADKLQAAIDADDELSAGKVFLVAATLRPETMFGQTNCFVLPKGEYVAVKTRGGEIFVTAARAARAMSYQDRTPKTGQVDVLATFKGSDLLGLAVKAPRAVYDKVYVLALETISMSKGTGVVTSVPSDAPDDYAALRDFQTDEKLRAKYGITEDMVKPFEVVPIIDVPEWGKTAAVTACAKYKVKNMHDTKNLKKAKEIVYKMGFYEGVMLVGSMAGQKVEDAKPVMKKQMIEEGDALLYWEPEEKVVSRTGDECIVALIDQWYLRYGSPEWRDRVKAHVAGDSFHAYTPVAERQYMVTLDWLKSWACSRSFGLGTQIPWDEQFVIESLSDSTLYFAFYTVAHLLQGADNVDGKKTGPLGIPAEKMTDAVWDYAFTLRPESDLEAVAALTGIPAEKLSQLRRSFQFWYPMDMRVSGKDLIKNHLTMALYNHAAVFEEQPELWPRSYFTNGMVLVDNEKMSKSKGNFITLHDGCVGEGEKCWCADALRYAMAAAGDSMEDANFSTSLANKAILTLINERDWNQKCLDAIAKGDDSEFRSAGTEMTEVDLMCTNAIDCCVVECDKAYVAMRYRDVMKHGHNNLLRARDLYRDICAKSGRPMHAGVVTKFIRTHALIMAPIYPHVCEYFWRKQLKEKGSVVTAAWPAVGHFDVVKLRASFFLGDMVSAVRGALSKAIKGAGNKTAAVTVCIMNTFPAWKQALLAFLGKVYKENGETFPDDIMKQCKVFAGQSEAIKEGLGTGKRVLQNVMKVAKWTIEDASDEENGRGEEAFELELPYSQADILEENKLYISETVRHMFGLEEIDINFAVDGAIPEEVRKADRATPGRPHIQVDKLE